MAKFFLLWSKVLIKILIICSMGYENLLKFYNCQHTNLYRPICTMKLHDIKILNFNKFWPRPLLNGPSDHGFITRRSFVTKKKAFQIKHSIIQNLWFFAEKCFYLHSSLSWIRHWVSLGAVFDFDPWNFYQKGYSKRLIVGPTQGHL